MSYPLELEKRNNLVEKMESMVSKAKTENRSLSAAENKTFNEYKREIEKLDLELSEQSIPKDNSLELRGLNPQEQKEIRSFINFVKSGGTETRDLSFNGSNAVVPRTVADMVISRVKELAPWLNLIQMYNVRGNLAVPKYDWNAHTSTGFATDLQQITNSAGTLLTVDLSAHSIVSLSLIGRDLVNTTEIDVIRIIVDQMSMSIASFLSDELINDTSGVFSGTLNDITNTVTAGATGVIGFDDLVNLQTSVKSMFVRNGVWLMNPSTLASIYKLKDTAGNPLLIGGNENMKSSLGYTLLGSPVILDESVKANAVGNKFLFYGDFQAGVIGNTNMPMTVQLLTERYADMWAYGCLIGQTLDFNLGNDKAIAALVGK